MSTDSHPIKKKPGDTYVMDQENVAEMARLVDQDRLITESMGGLFPPHLALSAIHDVLDIACGPGGWAIEVARTYPQMQVSGIDISRLMVAYARMQAVAQELSHTSFRVMDITRRPLRFADASFDFVNARLLFSFMRPDKWPPLIRECQRILRPGGVLRLTECELALTDSPAFEAMASLFAQALRKAGQSFSPDGRTVGITPKLRNFLRVADFEDLQHAAYAIDWSYGSKGYEGTVQDFLIGLKLGQPFLVSIGITTEEAWDRLYEQAMAEMQAPTFCALWFYFSTWGRKPSQEGD
ncbi:MAG: class I SAM-dependent methyltransferase [Ktedonobacteraceae bacterium]